MHSGSYRPSAEVWPQSHYIPARDVRAELPPTQDRQPKSAKLGSALCVYDLRRHRNQQGAHQEEGLVLLSPDAGC